MMKNLAIIGTFLASLMLWPIASFADDLPDVVSGKPTRIVDGDTIHLDGHIIRLASVDAPEIGQYCQDRDGVAWPCGRYARDVLAGMINAGGIIDCKIVAKDRYNRLVGRCFSGVLDVQKALVASGLGVASYSNAYTDIEEDARTSKKGIWEGEFLRPQEYRKSN